ncbi:MAG: type II toxin-antitoxin system PemK/MazF family toxin [Chloroflexi bacterium]|nr:MAG: type II toxin-antitoxin system PemK/MazF family toxin [Chloroflexota bacterium]MCQ3936916.1 type II toxin-antitoxin system PemK/MazF family toxin [Chloroflexota bacterium]MDL1942752.1 type II toxin-antitoxin system PemK/MazF family toxin [Chloroflexi bacterium CFX2]
MVIHQGDVCYGEQEGSKSGYTRPLVVTQNNVFNLSWLNTVIVCAITSNLKRAASPGNVLLEEGEANLSKASVVLVTQVFTADKEQLGEYIGTLSKKRVRQILNGVELVTEPREIE